MALVISTKDQLYLTGLQHRAINKSTSITQEAEILNAGNKMLVTIKGGTTNTLSIATGFVVLSGVVVENTTVVEKTFGNPTPAGNYVLVFKIDMSTNTPSLNTQLASVSRTTNDLTVTTSGIYEYVLATMTVSATGVISNLVSAVPYPTPGSIGSYTLKDINLYNNTGSQALSNGVADNLNLTKLVGNLPVSSGYNIILYKGFYYEFDYAINILANPTSGTALAEATISATGATVYGVRASVRAFNSTYGAGDNVPGSAVIDLTSAGSDAMIKLRASLVEGNSTVRAGTWLKIKQYKKVV